jgi:hypothetical protein
MKLISISLLALLWADAPKPPVVPEALKTEFFQAQANMIAANAQAQEKRATFTELYKQINAACGEGFQWSQTDGDKNGWGCTATKIVGHDASKPEPKRP